jgi:anti-sigma B factor antagonist
VEIKTKDINDIKVVEIHGEIDGSTAPEAQAMILSLSEGNARMVLDMSGVPYMSSAGLRLLLVTYRSIAAKGGKVVLVGLSEDLKSTMTVTGFLDFMTHRDTLDDGVAALA